MKRKFVLIIAALALTLLMGGVSQAFVLNGTFLDVGVSTGGGLVDTTVPQGITFLPGPLPNDFTYPGTPFEYYSIGVGGVFTSAGVPAATGGINPFGLTTADLSAGTTNQATSTGPAFALGGASLIYTQHVTFDDSFKHVHVSVDILNNSLVDITDLVYSRGMDPDQDVELFGDFRTINTISGAEVTAVGPLTNLFVTMRDLTPGIDPVASVSGPIGGVWVTDPYNLSAGGFLNGATLGTLEDASINLTYDIGFLAHGTSIELDFEYEFNVVPVPPSVWLFGSGLLGLVGLRFRQKFF
jgi:hypothetical protein